MSRQRTRAKQVVGSFFRKAAERQKSEGTFGIGQGRSQVARPYRALAPGMQYIGGDRVGGKAAERRLRQAAKLELKRLRKQHGIDSPMFQGMGPGGALLLELPAAGPTRAVPPAEPEAEPIQVDTEKP